MSDPQRYRAPALLCAALLCFCAGGLYGWSALIPVIEFNYAASAAQSGLVFSSAIVAFSVAVMVTPRLPSGCHGLTGCALFGFVGAGCLVLAMMASSYLLFLIAFGVGFGLCSGAIYINVLGMATKTVRPAVITPLMIASFGMGGAVFGLWWRILVVKEWGAMALMPLVVALLLSSTLGFIIASRLPRSLTVKTAVLQQQGSVEKPVIFVLLWLSFALGSSGGLMVLGLAGKITDSIGASPLITSLAIVGVAIGNTLGRASVSGCNHLIKPVQTALIAAMVVLLGLVITGVAESPVQLSAGLVTVAFGYGAVASIIPVLVATIYGSVRFSRVYSFVFSAWGIAGLLAPWLAGLIYDSTDNFRWAVVIALLATLGAIISLVLLKRIALPLR